MQLKLPKRIVLLTVITFLFVAMVVVFAKDPNNGKNENDNDNDEAVVINVLAKAGYTPKLLIAPAHQNVILRVETRNTYDCSAAFSIPSLNVDTLLPATGFTDFEIAPQNEGNVITAGCSMGMYGLQVKFQ